MSHCLIMSITFQVKFKLRVNKWMSKGSLEVASSITGGRPVAEKENDKDVAQELPEKLVSRLRNYKRNENF